MFLFSIPVATIVGHSILLPCGWARRQAAASRISSDTDPETRSVELKENTGPWKNSFSVEQSYSIEDGTPVARFTSAEFKETSNSFFSNMFPSPINFTLPSTGRCTTRHCHVQTAQAAILLAKADIVLPNKACNTVMKMIKKGNKRYSYNIKHGSDVEAAEKYSQDLDPESAAFKKLFDGSKGEDWSKREFALTIRAVSQKFNKIPSLGKLLDFYPANTRFVPADFGDAGGRNILGRALMYVKKERKTDAESEGEDPGEGEADKDEAHLIADALGMEEEDDVSAEGKNNAQMFGSSLPTWILVSYISILSSVLQDLLV